MLTNNELKRPEKIRVEEERLEYCKTGIYTGVDYKYLGEPFTGFAVVDYHDNRNIASEIEYNNGEQLGWEIEYYDNGKISYEALMYGETTILFNEYDLNGNYERGGACCHRRTL